MSIVRFPKPNQHEPAKPNSTRLILLRVLGYTFVLCNMLGLISAVWNFDFGERLAVSVGIIVICTFIGMLV